MWIQLLRSRNMHIREWRFNSPLCAIFVPATLLRHHLLNPHCQLQHEEFTGYQYHESISFDLQLVDGSFKTVSHSLLEGFADYQPLTLPQLQRLDLNSYKQRALGLLRYLSTEDPLLRGSFDPLSIPIEGGLVVYNVTSCPLNIISCAVVTTELQFPSLDAVEVLASGAPSLLYSLIRQDGRVIINKSSNRLLRAVETGSYFVRVHESPHVESCITETEIFPLTVLVAPEFQVSLSTQYSIHYDNPDYFNNFGKSVIMTSGDPSLGEQPTDSVNWLLDLAITRSVAFNPGNAYFYTQLINPVPQGAHILIFYSQASGLINSIRMEAGQVYAKIPMLLENGIHYTLTAEIHGPVIVPDEPEGPAPEGPTDPNAPTQ